MTRYHKLLAQAEDKVKEAKMATEDWRYGEGARLYGEAEDLKQQAENWPILVLKIKVVTTVSILVCIAIYFIVLSFSHPALTSAQLLITYWSHYLVGFIIMLLVFWWNQIIKRSGNKKNG